MPRSINAAIEGVYCQPNRASEVYRGKIKRTNEILGICLVRGSYLAHQLNLDQSLSLSLSLKSTPPLPCKLYKNSICLAKERVEGR